MIENLVSLEPFSLHEPEKRPVFLRAMQEAILFHYNNCENYRNFCKKRGFEPAGDFSIQDIPFLPVDVFKDVKLISVPAKDIHRTVHSSATTTGTPSSVYLDETSMSRQTRTLNSIISNFIGEERRDFIFIDSPNTIKSVVGELSSRATTMRGLLPFSRKSFFVLNDKLEPDEEALGKALDELGGLPTIYGFTYMIYEFVKSDPRIRKRLSKKTKGCIVLHSGGWKKLTELQVKKEQFNREVSDFFSTSPGNVIDMYGMVEHMGVIYPDCPCGFKHVPVYSDVLIRDVNSFELVADGKPGFIQLLSPIPHSYPGISIISADIGAVMGSDDCKCGRLGKYFVFKHRAEKSEIRGCGDTLGE